MQDRFKFKVKFEIDGQVEIFDVIDISFEYQQVFFRRQDNIVYNTGLGVKGVELIQCTGLKDKNGLNLLFENDIINTEGIKIGNCYENEYLLKDTTNFVIKGMGTKEWRNSEQEAIKRGCYYAE